MHESFFSSNSTEWFTPHYLLEHVEEVLGPIDLDPASNDPPNVPAAQHYTKADDGLSKPWRADTLFLNPPYGKEIVPFVEKLVSEYEAGNVKSAIALLPARTDTEWFSRLAPYPRCFVSGRVQFLSGNDSAGDHSAPFPSVFVYLGPDRERFQEVFAKIGTISVDAEELVHDVFADLMLVAERHGLDPREIAERTVSMAPLEKGYER